MSLFVIYVLCTGVLGSAINRAHQTPLRAASANHDESLDSIIKLCPESRPDDLLEISEIVHIPEPPWYDEEFDIFIWGNFSQDIPVTSTVGWQVNVTNNNGDFGSASGTFHICDYLEKMMQPGNPSDMACPPVAGPVYMNYAGMFPEYHTTTGLWSAKFDAKTPDGQRIYCLQAEFDLQCPPWYRGDPIFCRNHTASDVDLLQ